MKKIKYKRKIKYQDKLIPTKFKKKNEQLAASQDPARLKAIQDADNAIEALKSHYKSLDKNGGMVNTDKGTIDNAMAALSSSGVGQYLGGVIGSKEQADRQSIENLQSTMIPIVMKASGMTGGMLNSEAELRNFLKSFGNSKQAYQAVIEQLDQMKGMYGDRSGIKKPEGNANIDDLVNHYLSK